MKKAVLFDIDGTLLDAWDFIFDAVKYAVTAHGLPYPEEKNFKKALGKPFAETYRLLLPDVDPLMLEKIQDAHRKFQNENFHLIKPFPKTKSTLIKLKIGGFKIAAVSNRVRESLVRSLEDAKILDYFDTVVGPDDVKNPKPHKEHLLFALEKLRVNPANSYMVGDTPHDILAGKSAKVKTVGATYGFVGKKIAKFKPDFLIDDISELLKILK